MSEREVDTYTEDDDVTTMLCEWDRDLDRHWMAWRREARENFDIFAGQSWTKAEKLAMEDANRVPVEFNRVAPLVKAVVGAEIAGRLRVDYKPRTLGDAQTNELLTSGAEWIRDQCDAEGEESHAFMNALICGIGCTETRLDFEEDPEGMIIEDAVDSLEMSIDPSARKGSAIDAKYIRRKRDFTPREAKERFGEHAFSHDGSEDAGLGVDNPATAYSGQDGEKPDRDTVTVTEFQWYDLVTEHIVQDPQTGQTFIIDDERFQELNSAAEENGRAFMSAKRKRRVYYRAYMTGNRLIDGPEELPTEEFTYKFITGDYDRNAGVWFGLVRSMKDPQKWANKFFSQILHIISTNAKGGVMMEEDAVPDMREFEETWAAGDSATIFTKGSLKSGAVQPKPMGQYPAGIDKMMQFSQESIRETAGVNPEFLGLADRDQPGVLEHQRKQAAYGIMATYFDSLRRFRKQQGRLLLKLMRFLPQGTLIRVAMDDWENPRYVPMEQMALDLQSAKFDVIVDEAPTGPNQKERTFQVLLQILPMVQEMMTPDMWMEVLRYSPLPEAMVQKIIAAAKEAQEDPMAQLQKQLQQVGAQLQLADQQASVADKQAGTEQKRAQTAQTRMETLISAFAPDPSPQIIS